MMCVPAIKLFWVHVSCAYTVCAPSVRDCSRLVLLVLIFSIYPFLSICCCLLDVINWLVEKGACMKTVLWCCYVHVCVCACAKMRWNSRKMTSEVVYV